VTGPTGRGNLSTRAQFLRRSAGAALLALGPLGDAAGLLAGDAEAAHPRQMHPESVQHFYSRPDLRPPLLDVVRPSSGTNDGLLFLAPVSGPGQSGPLIVDDNGQPVWFKPTTPLTATDFRTARFHGNTVLTWWEGSRPDGLGEGEYVIADATYREIARFGAGNHRGEDEHEFLLTPEGTALITSWEKRTMSLRPIGGRSRATVIGGVVQELEIPSSRVLFEWRSLDHVDVAESLRQVQDPYDYFHVNSIDLAPDGDLLVSARNTWAVYKLSRKDGRVVWRLGGKRSDFRLGRDAAFAWQHDARFHGHGRLVSIFDNAVGPGRPRQSRAIVLELDERRRRATLVRELEHRPALYARAFGNVQLLPDGGYLVGWGTEPYVTQYASDGTVRYEARLPHGGESYRAFRLPWVGRPAEPPTLYRRILDRTKVYASWNGATGVHTWQLRAGTSADALQPASLAPRTGFEAGFVLPAGARYAAVTALDGHGRPLGSSKPLAV
jgi:hypothetical protein